MASQKVTVVFDRKKVAEKRGQGIVEMQVYLSRRERKYIPIGKSRSNNFYKGTDQATNFIIYLKESIDKERFSDGTRKHKICTLEAVKRFSKIRTNEKFRNLTLNS